MTSTLKFGYRERFVFLTLVISVNDPGIYRPEKSPEGDLLVGAVLLFCRGGDEIEVEDEVEGGFFIFFENGAEVFAPDFRVATLFL